MKFLPGTSIAALALALGLSACDSKPAPTSAGASAGATTATAAPLCTAPVSREIALTAPDAKDKLEAEAIGADCSQAVIVFTLHNAAGKLMWTHAVEATNTWAFVPDQDNKAVPPADGVHRMMEEALKNAELSRSKSAPDWPEGKERPEDPTGLFHVTEHPRGTYLDMRNKDLPMLCIDHRMGQRVCVVFDPMFPDLASELYRSQS